MEIRKIVLLIALAFAIVAGIADVPHAAAILAALGLLAGFFVPVRSSLRFLVCAIALALAHAAPAAIPLAGPPLAAVLASISTLFNASACTVVLRLALRGLLPSPQAG